MSTVSSSSCRSLLILIVGFIFGSLANGWATTRQDEILSDGWRFTKNDAGLTSPTESWEKVTIPHTWNTVGADPGEHPKDPLFKSGYYRGACWYVYTINAPADWQNKRVFLRFEAASLVAKSYLNGQPLGEHRGAFTAFCYELTPFLHPGSANELRVQVDNSGQKDIAPLAGDFNIDGGLYRPVHLIVTDAICVSPLDLASPGVYLTTKSLSSSSAEVEVKTLASNGKATPADIQVQVELTDDTGKVVATQTQPVTLAAGQTQPVVTTLKVSTPHLWNGRKDPYLYATTVSLLQGTETSDAVTQSLGLRTVAISEEKGFLLNDQPYPIHGVNRHQDWGDQGWAAETANLDQDAKIMLEMGVTAIRLAHYPQSDYLHNLCDHNGMLLWNEVPLVNLISKSPEFAANAERQLREMILQRYNHPSVAFWGLFNELGLNSTPAPDELLQHLKSIIQELDPSRLIVCAIYSGHTTYNQIADHPCFNRYPGWYAGIDQVDKMVAESAAEAGKRFAFSEYGAGANPDQPHEGPLTQKRFDKLHSEQWQTHVHEVLWTRFKDEPTLWGTFVWCMFDFQSARRKEGGYVGVNDKGLVTEDRKIKKDAYFFYQANWSDKPMVHIASSRMTRRQQASTVIEVFSNCEKVDLTVNGVPLAPITRDGINVFRWPSVSLQTGKNVILATATSSQGPVTDSCEWLLDTSSTPSPSAPATAPTQPEQ